MSDDFVPVHGNTFPVKDKLKAMGGRWDPQQECWFVPRVQKMAADVLVGNASYEQTQFCYTCGRTFTFAECRQDGGDWQEGWCGCKGVAV